MPVAVQAKCGYLFKVVTLIVLLIHVLLLIPFGFISESFLRIKVTLLSCEIIPIDRIIICHICVLHSLNVKFICKVLFISCIEHDVIQKVYAEFNSKIVISIKYGQIVDHPLLPTRELIREMYIFSLCSCLGCVLDYNHLVLWVFYDLLLNTCVRRRGRADFIFLGY